MSAAESVRADQLPAGQAVIDPLDRPTVRIVASVEQVDVVAGDGTRMIRVHFADGLDSRLCYRAHAWALAD